MIYTQPTERSNSFIVQNYTEINRFSFCNFPNVEILLKSRPCRLANVLSLTFSIRKQNLCLKQKEFFTSRNTYLSRSICFFKKKGEFVTDFRDCCMHEKARLIRTVCVYGREKGYFRFAKGLTRY